MPVNNQENETTQCCAACGKADKDLKQCSACKIAVYCDRSCQLAHRKDHKAECKRIEKALKAVATMPKANSLGLLSDIKKFGLPMPDKSVKAFWDTFLAKEAKIYRLARLVNAGGVDAIGDIILPRLKGGLGFETGPVYDADGKPFGLDHPIAEFCLHGAGLKENMNAILSLEMAVPTHLNHRWKFTFFKPRLPSIPFVSPGLKQTSAYKLSEEPSTYDALTGSIVPGNASDTRPIRFQIVPDDDIDKIGILLFVRGYGDRDHPNGKMYNKEQWAEISYHILDSILGEWDVEMHVGLIHIEPFGSEIFKLHQGGRALELLADEFDHWLAEKLQPHIRVLESQGHIKVEPTIGVIASAIGPKNFTGYVKPMLWKDLAFCNAGKNYFDPQKRKGMIDGAAALSKMIASEEELRYDCRMMFHRRYREGKCSCCTKEVGGFQVKGTEPTGMRCGDCQAVWYCDATCQKSDWDVHREECAVMKKERDARIAWYAKQNRQK